MPPADAPPKKGGKGSGKTDALRADREAAQAAREKRESCKHPLLLGKGKAIEPGSSAACPDCGAVVRAPASGP